MLNSSVKLAGEDAAKEGIESGDDSGKEPTPEKAKIRIKKKKGLKKKPKKTVFRNNFVKESDSQQQFSN